VKILNITTLYFVRHAHSVFSEDEAGRPLSDKGMKDAEGITSLLQKASINKVISSPYKRAVQTVEGVANHFNLKVEIVDDLRERKLSNHPVPNFQEAMDKVWGNPEFDFEGGESNVTAQIRGVKAISHILDKYKGQNIVIGTHGNIMVLIMNYFNQQYGYDFWKGLTMPDLYQLTFENQKLLHVQRVEKA
jgi:2,3-bisphosphoglycerate-dependent phosphoglycerate mutase